MVLIEFLSYLNITFITFLLMELLLSLVFTEDWKFRFNKAKGYSNLTPHSKSWKIILAFLILTFIVFPLIGFGLIYFFRSWFVNLGRIQIFILFGVAPMVYLWVKLNVIKKKSFNWWDLIPISITIISTTLFFIFWLK